MAGVTGINHIAFAVKNLKESLDNATEVLGGEIMMKFESIEDKYEGACVKFGSSIMSFITSHDPDSFIYKFAEKLDRQRLLFKGEVLGISSLGTGS